MLPHYTQDPRARARFWAKVEKTEGCWFWKGAIAKSGYGNFRASTAKTVSAHRAAWEFTHGPIENDDEVLHECDVRNCVRLSHLFRGTQADNMRDMHAKGRGMSGETHWLHSHPERSPQGERNGAAKLTEADVREIWRLHETGAWSMGRIGRHLGVSPHSIRNVLIGRTWTHVDRIAAA